MLDATGHADAGIFGDVLCARTANKGVAAVGRRADVLGPAGADWLRRRGRVPNDMIVVDDRAVLTPQGPSDAVAETLAEQEALESWIMGEVERGAALPGLYPPNAENKARYEASRRKR